MKVHLVLRHSPSFNVTNFVWLAKQIRDYGIVLLTDVPKSVIPTNEFNLEVIPLKNGWPGWWSKLELFDPSLAPAEDIFYMDLDTVVTGSLEPFMRKRLTTMLSDFYRPRMLGSALMYLTAADRETVWNAWLRSNPLRVIGQYSMRRIGFNGDQNFLESVLGADKVCRWQDDGETPVASYKGHIRKEPSRPYRKNEIILFHGKPRPWEVGYPR